MPQLERYIPAFVQHYSASVCIGIGSCLCDFCLLQGELVHVPDVRIDCGMISSAPV